MIVTFVSQCQKKALAKTRQILDSFANLADRDYPGGLRSRKGTAPQERF